MNIVSLRDGCNKYPRNALKGCHTDINTITARLGVFGLPGGNWFYDVQGHMLTSETQHACWLLEQTRPENGPVLFLFQYSGHGSQRPSLDGSEPDQLDECIVVSDETYFTDDDMGAVLDKIARLPHVWTLAILDCCHSGVDTSRGYSLDAPRFLPPPCGSFPATKPRRELAQAMCARERVCVLAACRPDQTAADAVIDSKPQGAFTWALDKAWESVGIDATPAQLIAESRNLLDVCGYTQVPQLWCSAGQPNRPALRPWEGA